MKRVLSSIVMVVIGLSAFSQSPSKHISLQSAYPLTVGNSSVGGIMLSGNGLYLYDTPLDSLPRYEIGLIDAQTVRYTENGYGFYLKADSLHSANVTYSYEFAEQPKGTIEFNEKTGRFKYYPTLGDYQSFVVTFSATNGAESVSEDVVFNMTPSIPSEADAFQSKGVMPSAEDYTVIAETSTSKFLNNQDRTAYSISLSGKDIVFDNAVQNKVWGLSGREDIYELNIYAERLIIRSALSFPETDVTIYAKELIFEDKGKEVASINTTPSPINTLTDGIGLNSGSAGRITIYAKTFKANAARRFILTGAQGQSTNRNGTPGKGGRGGNVWATVDVGTYCDLARGNGGFKYDVASDGTARLGEIIDRGSAGSSGDFFLIDYQPYAYLHPYYIAAVMRHVNDAFINNYTEEALEICREYHEEIEKSLTRLSDDGDVHEGIINGNEGLFEVRKRVGEIDMSDLIYAASDLALKNHLMDIDNILFRLERGLDYFGNPVGWSPLLSFEVMLANYNNEVDRAIPVLYLYYWLNHVEQTLQHKIDANKYAADATWLEIDDNEKEFNLLVQEMPVLQDETEVITNQIEELTLRIERLQKQLLEQAIHNVKRRNRINKFFGIFKTIANVIPFFGPVGEAIGSGMDMALDVASTGMSFFSWEDCASAISTVGDKTIETNFQEIKDSVDKIKKATSGNVASTVASAFKTMEKGVGPLTKSLQGLQKVLSNNTTSNSEVQQEYNKLLAESKDYKIMMAQVEDLNNKKVQLMNHLNEVFTNMTTTVSELSNDELALDAFRYDVFSDNSKRDLNTLLYLEKLQQRAKSRLLKYDYYLRKAYEYRMLKAYDGEEFNLPDMFVKAERLGMALDSEISASSYAALGAIFKERISDMTEKIIAEYSTNSPEQSAPITIVMDKEQLDAINSDEGLTLNFHEMGIFSPDEENVRIVDIGILHMDTHVEGKVGYSGYMDLNLTHSGISQFRKDGKLYWFDHMSRSSANPHTWGVRYDAIAHRETDIRPSAASASLLSSIIGDNDKIMIFSRPSAWSDIAINKKVHTSGGANIVIDSLVLNLQYDFTRRPNNMRNIDIAANEDLDPYIACSEADVSGKSDGNGRLYRSYRTSSQPVTFSAVNRYGNYYFVNWIDRAGEVVSDTPDLTISRSKDQFYTANYERRVPILSVPDTIIVNMEGGTRAVNVRNIGSGDTEMDWYVDESQCAWVHLDGKTEGVESGLFSFTYEANPMREERIDSLIVFAPETDTMSKFIYIVQSGFLPPETHLLTYMVDGKPYKSYEVEYGSEIFPEPKPAKEGLLFKGWQGLPKIMPAKDVTVTGTFIEWPKTNLALKLENGWNWISHNAVESLSLTNIFGENVIEVKSQTKGAVRDSRYGIVGNLIELLPTEAYKIKTIAADSKPYQLSGKLFDAEGNAITLYQGWNWIGYPVADEQSVEVALENFSPKEGDMLVGFEDFSVFANGSWIGTMNVLTPGNGYMYKSLDTKKSVYYSEGSDSDVNVNKRAMLKVVKQGAQATQWAYDIHKYPNRMPSIICISQVDVHTYELAAFCGDECRGVALVVNDVMMMNVCGEGGETITFKAFNKQTGAVHDINESVLFTGDALGSYKTPFMVTLGEEEASGIAIVQEGIVEEIIYTPNGRRINQPQKGVNIIKQTDGNVKKVIVK